MNTIINYFPRHIQTYLKNIPEHIKEDIEEVCVGIGRPIIIRSFDCVMFVSISGKISRTYDNCYIVTNEDIKCIVQLITEGSVYAVTEKIKNGFITLPVGHRVGITGTTITENDNIVFIKNISSLNFRISRQIKGISQNILPYILRENKVRNTIILGPPKSGKTTYLKDISYALGCGRYNLKISIVDERGEIAAMNNGIAQNDIGIFCDVLEYCPKSEGMKLVVRSMAPDVIITDEISQDDIDSVKYILRCGVNLITTIHGYNENDLPDDLKKYFKTIIVLGNTNGTGTIEKIIECE